MRLKEQLSLQRRDTLSKDREYWKKNNKSKNILKKGLKKLKDSIQVVSVCVCMCACVCNVGQ